MSENLRPAQLSVEKPENTTETGQKDAPQKEHAFYTARALPHNAEMRVYGNRIEFTLYAVTCTITENSLSYTIAEHLEETDKNKAEYQATLRQVTPLAESAQCILRSNNWNIRHLTADNFLAMAEAIRSNKLKSSSH